MSMTDAIHLHYNEEPASNLEYFLQRQAAPGKQVFVFISAEKLMLSEITIPTTFIDDDILQSIAVEQARLFPMLEEKIYVDFLVKEENENEKRILIAACNVSDFHAINSLLNSFELSWVSLGVNQEALKTLNLLPWRQYEKQRVCRARWKIIGLTIFLLGLLMLIISLLFIKIAANDDEKERVLFSQLAGVKKNVRQLENINKAYRVLMRRWRENSGNAQVQARIAKIFATIELSRPENLILDEIAWHDHRLFLQGRAKDVGAVKKYIKNLRQYSINGKLNFMSADVNKLFPVHFEIESGFNK